jgi:Mrp family chromosome partitioning ATPase
VAAPAPDTLQGEQEFDIGDSYADVPAIPEIVGTSQVAEGETPAAVDTSIAHDEAEIDRILASYLSGDVPVAEDNAREAGVEGDMPLSMSLVEPSLTYHEVESHAPEDFAAEQPDAIIEEPPVAKSTSPAVSADIAADAIEKELAAEIHSAENEPDTETMPLNAPPVSTSNGNGTALHQKNGHSAAFADLAATSGPLAVPQAGPTPTEFIHLYAAIESFFMDQDAPSEVSLGTMAEEGLRQDRPYVLGITSSIGGEGKTTTAIQLALTMAKNSYKRICLLDLSLDESGGEDLGARLGLSSTENQETLECLQVATSRGVVDVIERNALAVPTYQMLEPDNLTIVPRGDQAKRPARCARSPKIAQLLQSAKQAFDVIIVDLPPISSENVPPLARHLDGVMLVVQAGATPREVVQQAVETLGREHIVGVALNRYKNSVPAWLMRLLHLQN